MKKMDSQIQVHKKLIQIEKQIHDLESFKADILELLKEMGAENYYPPESKFKKSSLERLEKALANVKKGKVRHFKNFNEFLIAHG